MSCTFVSGINEKPSMDELNLASERVQELIARLSNVNFYCSVVGAGSVLAQNSNSYPEKKSPKSESSVKKIHGGKNSA